MGRGLWGGRGEGAKKGPAVFKTMAPLYCCLKLGARMLTHTFDSTYSSSRVSWCLFCAAFLTWLAASRVAWHGVAWRLTACCAREGPV